MAQRLARVLHAPHGRDGAVTELDLEPLQRRLRVGVAPGGGGGLRGGARRALLRALRPYSVHQRLLDEEIVRAVRTLDERVRGVAAAQSVLAAELRELRSDDRGTGVPPSPAS
jgi:hypothetical protein